jgi:hypothetical protein
VDTIPTIFMDSRGLPDRHLAGSPKDMTEAQELMNTAARTGMTPDSTLERLVPRELQDAFLEREARVRRFIQTHPVPVVLGALAVGFLLARLVRED